MNISEIRGGDVFSLDLALVDGPARTVFPARAEVRLFRSGSELLMAHGAAGLAVRGTSQAHVRLLELIDSQAPFVAWLARMKGDRAVLQVHRFQLALPTASPIEIGIDDAVMADLRGRLRAGDGIDEIARWLDREALLPGPDGQNRAIVCSGRGDALGAFRIVGSRFMLAVRRDGLRFRLERVIRGGAPKDLAMTLLTARLTFTDRTAATEFTESARHALEEAVRSDTSYMRIWQEYSRIEHDAVRRRVAAVGILPYSRAEEGADGGWRFTMEPTADLEARLESLGDGGRFELEAALVPPNLDTLESQGPRGDVLVAPLRRVDAMNGVIELAPVDADDRAIRPPPSGCLHLSFRGNLAVLQRRERAEEQLRTGNCGMPWLGLLLEDRPGTPPTHRIHKATSAAVLEAFGGRPTAAQQHALDVALNTPDIALIQGPPGTGKTKVIAALQRRIAELGDSDEEGRRILVTSTQHEAVDNLANRSEVFGLPPRRVGGRRGGEETLDGVERFRLERVEALEADLRDPPDSERLSSARRSAVAILKGPLPPDRTAHHLRILLAEVTDLVTPASADRLRARIRVLERPDLPQADAETAQLRLDAARGLSASPAAFLDGGPRRAALALGRLRDVLTAPERGIVEACAEWIDDAAAPAWLPDVASVRDALIDRLEAPRQVLFDGYDEETHQLLGDVMADLANRRRRTAHGETAVLADWLHDLRNDPTAVRQTVEHYTAVLASTLQHAASGEMRAVTGLDSDPRFDSVIVDEAARCHPLDLFIPMAMARRRIVLVGDHRQLPHMLEPNVERDLADQIQRGDLAEETLAALRNSLFGRLWEIAERLQSIDGRVRRATLDAQFRMHPLLGAFVSRQFYERGDRPIRLESPRPATAFHHRLSGFQKAGSPAAAAWIDVPGGPGRSEVRSRSSLSRAAEANVIAREVRAILDEDDTVSIGVVAFYRAQVDAIWRELERVEVAVRTGSMWNVTERFRVVSGARGPEDRLRVGTVDAFQGKEFDIVFLSVTRSSQMSGDSERALRSRYGHLLLPNRLCVAMSRQQRLLAVVGDLDFVRAAQPLEPFHAFIELCEGPHGVIR